MSAKAEKQNNLRIYLFFVIFYYISLGGFNFLQSLYIKELKISDNFLGLIISAKTFVYAIFAFLAVIVINKLGKKRTLICSTIITSFLTVLFGFSTNKYLLLILTILHGLTISIFAVTEPPFLSDNSDKRRSIKAFSYTFSINMFSVMFSYLLFGKLTYVLSLYFSYLIALRFSIIISGLIGFIFIIGAIKINEKKKFG
ncbi:MAG: MFS transporter [Caloramator sp.]|nr:MFS transporter [Caloramator sp.]